MKTFIITLTASLFAAIAAALVVPFLQDYVSEERIEGDVYRSVWSFPVSDTELPENLQNILKYIKRIDSRAKFNYMYIALENNGRETAKDVKIRSEFEFDLVLVSSRVGSEEFRNVKVIPVPDMYLGEEVKIYVWDRSLIDNIFRYSWIESFSSKGPIRFKMYTRDQVGFRVESIFFVFAIIIGLFLLALLFGVAIFYENALKELLGDDNKYIEEKIRYDKDPKKYIFGQKTESDKKP